MTKAEPQSNPEAASDIAASGPSYTLRELLFYFLRLGTFGFGGPVALVGFMHRDLVERRRWISESDYNEGIALAQLAPGPLAAQLAIYLGYVHFKIVGATLVGLAFILPSFLMVVALGWAYNSFGGLSWMQAVFYGVGPCVIAIIANSAFKLTRRTIRADRLKWAIFLVSAASTVVTESEIIWLFLGAGVVTWLVKCPPKWPSRPPAMLLALAPASLWDTLPRADGDKLWQIFIFFTKAGAFVFGSGLAIVPFLYGGVVKENCWLNDQQFLDAVAVAMITPGPVVITVGFIGFLIGGFEGASVAAIGTFLPCYFFTVIPAPYFKRYGRVPAIKAFVDGVTAAAVGAIAGSVVVLGRRTILTDSWSPELPKIGVMLVSMVVLLRFKKLPEPIVVLGAALAGMALYSASRL